MWTVEYVSDVSKQEVDALPQDMRSHFERVVSLIEIAGLEKVHEPYVKHLEGKLWEIRLRGKDGIARSLYVTAHSKRVVVLRTFVKKTQKTPPKEIKLALKRAKDIK